MAVGDLRDLVGRLAVGEVAKAVEMMPKAAQLIETVKKVTAQRTKQ